EIVPEDFNAHFQSTYIWQHQPGFNAPYRGAFSLPSAPENSYTFSLTGAFGKRLWEGAELYFDPEVVQGVPLGTNLTGMAGFYNGEITRASGSNPVAYRVRLFLRQTWGMGGEQAAVAPAMNQLAGMADRNRTVLTAGFLPPLDIFDGNRYAHDPRTQFMNWCNMTHCAFDYAADARGNSWGIALEFYREAWVLRAGQFMQPRDPNQLQLDWQFFKHHGQNLELEHAHELAGQPGKFRLLAYRNTARTGSFADAMRDPGFSADNAAGIPATGTVRREAVKYGLGYNLEQAISPGIGVFSRFMWQDGRYETFAFTEAHRSFSLGTSLDGTLWNRERDTVGVAAMRNALSGVYRQYLAAGGLGYFIGDGKLSYADEQIVETYYSLGLRSDLWATLDYQYLRNPAYNADRGPVSIAGVRLHWEH
ncbi:MAG TPA: carbohydrate porin, partial [Sideroxyarcus sp.]|nr:carbohydrate porin [Sideroxyarcus sp.]